MSVCPRTDLRHLACMCHAIRLKQCRLQFAKLCAVLAKEAPSLVRTKSNSSHSIGTDNTCCIQRLHVKLWLLLGHT